jgi:lipopolysaccharide transport system ATP-binding protein
MENPVIKVESLSKIYRLGQIGTGTLSHDLNVWWAKLRGKTNPLLKVGETDYGNRDGEVLWALRKVSFSVKQGEVLGIIGRNGAGKSTLLKILARVTAPTEGSIKVKGRIASLLEVGTGFHPDLTGRENIYLNGAILGMSRKEIDRKFDEIVDFAEIGKFIDTPVKRYSSGMYVRLAFAVAAHLEPEILVVDEVLAVGDTAFQKKCLGKMGDVAKQGRTVMFVSHNMQAISGLCSSTILLDSGRIMGYDATPKVIAQYLSSGYNQSAQATWNFSEALGSNNAKLHSVSALDDDGEVCHDLLMNKAITLRAEFWILRKSRVVVSFHVYNQEGIVLFATGNFHEKAWADVEHSPGLYRVECIIPKHFLNEGQHYVRIYLDHDNPNKISIPEVISFRVLDPGDTRGDWTGTWIGMVRPILPWTGERIGDLP